MAPNHRSSREADLAQMQSLVEFTRARLGTEAQSPFGSSVVETDSGRLVLRRLNAVRQENDPSSHAEVRAMRAACKRLKKPSLMGHTLYTTCEPCPMCMAMALWSGVDRVVFGATIADATRHCAQIHVGPATRAALRHGLPRRRAGGSGQLRRPLRRPPHGYGHGALAEVTPEPGEAVGLPRLISAAPTSLSSVPIPA